MVAKVHKIHFWMRFWGAKTAKRTTLWSNSCGIRLFSSGHMSRFALRSTHKLTKRGVNTDGVETYRANDKLRMSQ